MFRNYAAIVSAAGFAVAPVAATTSDDATFKQTSSGQAKFQITADSMKAMNWNKDIVKQYANGNGTDPAASDDNSVSKYFADKVIGKADDKLCADVTTGLQTNCANFLTQLQAITGDGAHPPGFTKNDDPNGWTLFTYQNAFEDASKQVSALAAVKEGDTVTFGDVNTANTNLFYVAGMVNKDQKDDGSSTRDKDGNGSNNDDDCTSSCSCNSTSGSSHQGVAFKNFMLQIENLMSNDNKNFKAIDAYCTDASTKDQPMCAPWASFKKAMNGSPDSDKWNGVSLKDAINNFGQKAPTAPSNGNSDNLQAMVQADQTYFDGVSLTLVGTDGCSDCPGCSQCDPDSPMNDLTIDNSTAQNSCNCCCLTAVLVPTIAAVVALIVGLTTGFCCCDNSAGPAPTPTPAYYPSAPATPQPAKGGCSPALLVLILAVVVLCIVGCVVVRCCTRSDREDMEEMEVEETDLGMETEAEAPLNM